MLRTERNLKLAIRPLLHYSSREIRVRSNSTSMRRGVDPSTQRNHKNRSNRTRPATNAGLKLGYFSWITRRTAMECTNNAGWVFMVSLSFSSGPDQEIVESEYPKRRSASRKICFAREYSAAICSPIPIDCEPCPGNKKAIFSLLEDILVGIDNGP